MHAQAVPIKTERGRLALRERHFAGPRALRALLIMVDGRCSLDRLTPVMDSLGLSWQDFEQLADAGFITWLPSGSQRDEPVDIER